MAITEGMNRRVWHEFTSSPASTGLPGQEYFAGTHLNPKVTWWNAGSAFFTYLNRIQFMMQQGTPVDDILYFYGDNVPNFVRLKADDPAHALPGFDYDVTDEDALLHAIRFSGPSLTGPSGVTWRALVLPKTGRLSLPALEQIERYLQSGGTVIGEPPVSPTGMVSENAQTRFLSLVRAIWGQTCNPGSHHSYASGQIYCTHDAHAALEAMHILPDVEVSSAEPQTQPAKSDSPFDYAHRRAGTTDIYFLRNGSSAASQHDILFRAHGATVELWDPVTGEIHRLSDAAPTPDGRTRVHVDLAPYGSALILFSSDATIPGTMQFHTAQAQPFVIKGNWSLTFQPGRGAPTRPINFTDLKSWTDSPNDAIRYFSGTATYKAEASAPDFAKDEQVLLHFPEVHEVARVKINGHDAGTVWAQPLTLRVDPWLKKGINIIEIEVTNLWPNRIIGDLQPAAIQHYTSTNITTYRPDSPLLPSGLIGNPEWLIER
jgi:hypothetical protein